MLFRFACDDVTIVFDPDPVRRACRPVDCWLMASDAMLLISGAIWTEKSMGSCGLQQQVPEQIRVELHEQKSQHATTIDWQRHVEPH